MIIYHYGSSQWFQRKHIKLQSHQNHETHRCHWNINCKSMLADRWENNDDRIVVISKRASKIVNPSSTFIKHVHCSVRQSRRKACFICGGEEFERSCHQNNHHNYTARAFTSSSSISSALSQSARLFSHRRNTEEVSQERRGTVIQPGFLDDHP